MDSLCVRGIECGAEIMTVVHFHQRAASVPVREEFPIPSLGAKCHDLPHRDGETGGRVATVRSTVSKEGKQSEEKTKNGTLRTSGLITVGTGNLCRFTATSCCYGNELQFISYPMQLASGGTHG